MANLNSPYGFLPYRNLVGRGISQETVGTLSNTTYFVGEPVRTTATSYTGTSSMGAVGTISPPFPAVLLTQQAPCVVAAAGAVSTKTGYIWGILTQPVTGTAKQFPNVTMVPALPEYVFTAQHIGSVKVTAGFVGKTAGLVAGGSAAGCGISLSAAAVIAFSQFVVVGLNPRSKWGTYAELLCIVKHSQYLGQTV
jgi:hypothetical protein